MTRLPQMHAPTRRAGWTAWLLSLWALLFAAAAHAGVPNEDAVPAYAEEQTVQQTEAGIPEPGWGSARSGINHFDRHFLEPPGRMPEQDVVLQRGGNTWRQLHNQTLATIAGVVIVLTLLGLAAAWALIGPARTPPERGRAIRRFSDWQRHIHWATAIAFIVLALTGLTMLFGKKLLLPWMGHDLFSWVAAIGKYLHNVAGPVFLACSVLMFATFVRHNRFDRADWRWVRRAGGLLGGGPVPAGYFNAGEKLWFWFGLSLLGLLMSVTGLVLDFPYWGDVGRQAGSTRYVQQWANALHLLGASFYVAGALGHSYLGTLGTPGTYRGMRHGTVDEAWAEHHHPLWVEQMRSTSASVGGEAAPILDAPPARRRGARGPRGPHGATP